MKEGRKKKEERKKCRPDQFPIQLRRGMVEEADPRVLVYSRQQSVSCKPVMIDH